MVNGGDGGASWAAVVLAAGADATRDGFLVLLPAELIGSEVDGN